MRIYTRAGDGGETGLRGGRRVPKSDPRIAAYGCVDELNAALGVAAASRALDGDMAAVLSRVQGDLFAAGADLSAPDAGPGAGLVGAGMVRSLEGDIDAFEGELEPLANFVVPGGDALAASLHHARAVARRAEALVAALRGPGGSPLPADAACLRYLNRLSDLLFVMARAANRRAGVPDAAWMPK